MKPSSALLFAAGFGTRMRPLTDDRPKPLINVAGRSLLDHALEQVAPLHLSKTVVNAHYLHEQISAHLIGRDIAVSVELPDILDTGGGLRAAQEELGPGPHFTLNTDAVWLGPNPLELLQAAWEPDKMDALLLCVPHEQTIGRSGQGDFSLSEEGQLKRGGPLTYSGAQIIMPRGIEAIEDTTFSLNVLWNQMAEEGRLYGLTYPGRWCDVGHPGGIALAEEALGYV